jgi:hypothetical protein
LGVVEARTGKVFSKPSRSRSRYPLDKAKGYEIVWPAVAPVLEAGSQYPDAVYVYLIGEEDEGCVKIGLAKDPIARLREMQTGNPRRLRVDHVVLGCRELEQLLHEYWEDFAIFSTATRGRVGAAPRTEWFRADIRATLYPIIADAAARQVKRLAGGNLKGFDSNVAIKMVRQAHARHGFVAKGLQDASPRAAYPKAAQPQPTTLHLLVAEFGSARRAAPTSAMATRPLETQPLKAKPCACDEP